VIVSAARTLCEGNLITFTNVLARMTNSRVPLVFAQPGHWLGPVTGLGRLGPTQPMWTELGPAPQNKKK